MIGDINCCTKGSFEGLYKELEFIHKYEIKQPKQENYVPDKINLSQEVCR
jgi:hypothetical protein